MEPAGRLSELAIEVAFEDFLVDTPRVGDCGRRAVARRGVAGSLALSVPPVISGRCLLAARPSGFTGTASMSWRSEGSIPRPPGLLTAAEPDLRRPRHGAGGDHRRNRSPAGLPRALTRSASGTGAIRADTGVTARLIAAFADRLGRLRSRPDSGDCRRCGRSGRRPGVAGGVRAAWAAPDALDAAERDGLLRLATRSRSAPAGTDRALGDAAAAERHRAAARCGGGARRGAAAWHQPRDDGHRRRAGRSARDVADAAAARIAYASQPGSSRRAAHQQPPSGEATGRCVLRLLSRGSLQRAEDLLAAAEVTDPPRSSHRGVAVALGCCAGRRHRAAVDLVERAAACSDRVSLPAVPALREATIQR